MHVIIALISLGLARLQGWQKHPKQAHLVWIHEMVVDAIWWQLATLPQTADLASGEVSPQILGTGNRRTKLAG